MDTMSLKIDKPLVSSDWLNAHLDLKQLIVLDCTIPKVSLNTFVSEEKTQIKGAVYFDIKIVFLIINQHFQIPFYRQRFLKKELKK